jgi:nitroreductase
MSHLLPLNPDELLSTTRSVRKRLDLQRAVPMELIRECIELAIQAPSGSNSQGWHFVIVTDPAKKQAIAELYRKAWQKYAGTPAGSVQSIATQTTKPQNTMQRVINSADYLAVHLQDVPVWLIPCIEGRTDNQPNWKVAGTFGSILPAVWSFMLAARARGLAGCWTTLHLMYEAQAAEILGIPYQSITQVALIPVAYSIGTDFKPAERKSLETILHTNAW